MCVHSVGSRCYHSNVRGAVTRKHLLFLSHYSSFSWESLKSLNILDHFLVVDRWQHRSLFQNGRSWCAFKAVDSDRVLCRWGQEADLHSRTFARCVRWTGTNCRAPAFPKGARGPPMLHMFLYFLAVSLSVLCTNWPLQTKPKSLCNWVSLSDIVQILLTLIWFVPDGVQIQGHNI